jgi:hypothetical protein
MLRFEPVSGGNERGYAHTCDSRLDGLMAHVADGARFGRRIDVTMPDLSERGSDY